MRSNAIPRGSCRHLAIAFTKALNGQERFPLALPPLFGSQMDGHSMLWPSSLYDSINPVSMLRRVCGTCY